jgi:hypothetical protein
MRVPSHHSNILQHQRLLQLKDSALSEMLE